MVLRAAKTRVQYLRSITTFPSWHCQSPVLAASGTRNTNYGSDPGGGSSQRQKLWLEALLSNSSECWNNGVGALLTWHQFFQDKRDARALWLNNLSKPRVPALGAGGAKWFSSVRSCRRSDEIASLCKEGQLDRAVDALFCMDQQGVVPSVESYRCLLSACTEKKALSEAKRVHAHLVKHGLESTRYLGESVVKTLVKCGSLGDALQVFQRLQKRSVVSWTSLISAYTDTGQGQEALRVYQWMLVEGVPPNAYTFVSLLKACSGMADLEEGKRIHAEAVKYGCGSDLFVGNCLVNMYGSCGSIADAQKVFDGLAERDTVSWNAILAAHVLNGQADNALLHYEQMQEEGGSPNSRTFLNVLLASGMLADKEQGAAVDGQTVNVKSFQIGKVVHAEAWKKGCDDDVFFGTTLVRVYGKCGSILDAQNVLDKLTNRNVVSWNAMLAVCVEQYHAVKALHLYDEMLRDGLKPDPGTFVSAVQACSMLAEKKANVVEMQFSKVNSLEKGKILHAYAWSKGYESDVFVGSSLVSLYGNCGTTADAEHVFSRLLEQNVATCNAMLAAYVKESQTEKALQLYEQMHQEGVSPDVSTLLSVLQACGILAEKEVPSVVGQYMKVKSLSKVKAIHAHGRKNGYDSDAFLSNTLVNVYRKCGSVSDAQNVFDALSGRDVVSWTSILAAYVEHGQPEKAWQMYERMREEGVSPDTWTFVSVLQACGMLAGMKEEHADLQSARIKFLERGKKIHADAWRKWYDNNVFVGSTLVSMYGKCGSIDDARNVFDEMPERNVVSWNAMLAAYIDQHEAEKGLQMYEQMHEEDISPDAWTFVSACQACGMVAEEAKDILSLKMMKYLQQGRAIHAHAWLNGYESEVFVVSTLISMYGSYRFLTAAHCLFNNFSGSNVVVWNAMLMAYVEQRQAENAFQLYRQIWEEGVSPDACTFVSLFQACGILAEEEEGFAVDGHIMRVKALERGKAIHSSAKREGYGSDVFVGSTLVSMYGKCGSIVDAQRVFDGLTHPDVVAWTAVLSAYIEQGKAEGALQIYDQMQQNGVTPDARTFVGALQACSMLAEKDEDGIDVPPSKQSCLLKANRIYADAQRKGYGSDVFVCSTLLSLYGKCGDLVGARAVFNSVRESSVVLWNAMLMAYVEQEEGTKALELYSQMQKEAISPVARTFVCLFQACGQLAAKEESSVSDGASIKAKSMRRGKALHLDVEIRGYQSDVFVTNSLITMYGKCGSTVDAWNVFDASSQKDVVSWNAMLAVYVEHGKGEKAFDLFRKMQQEGPGPDDITLVCILQACSKTGSLAILRHMHHNLISIERHPTPVVASALIHAYGRCASMVDAQAVFDALPDTGVVSWNAIIAGYARQGDCMASLQQYEKMQLSGVHPNGVTFISLLSACSHAGLVDKGVEYFESMSRDHGVTPGIEHYVTMVDLLGRAGCFAMIEYLMSSMPMQPSLDLWLCLLGACRKHGKVVLGEKAFDCAVSLQPTHAAAYVLMSNIYADTGLLDLASEVRQKGTRKTPGQSWIECEEEVSSFLAGDAEHPRHEQVYDLLKKANSKLKYEEHAPDAYCLMSGRGEAEDEEKWKGQNSLAVSEISFPYL